MFVSLIIYSALCFAGPDDDRVISIMNKIYHDPTGRKVEIAEILIKRVNNNVLDKISKVTLNKFLSNLALKYGEQPKELSYLLFSDADKDLPAQIDLLIDIYSLDKKDSKYIELMIKEKGMSKLVKMDKNDLGNMLISLYEPKEESSKEIVPQIEEIKDITPSEPEEVRMSGLRAKNYNVEDDSKATGNSSVTEKLGDYIMACLERIYHSQEQAVKQFKTLKLKNIDQFVKESVKEMTIDLFSDAHLSLESLTLLSDREVFGEITKALGIKKNIPEFFDYLSDKVKEMIQDDRVKYLVDPDWKKGLEESKKELYRMTSGSSDYSAMTKWLRSQIKNKVAISDIVDSKRYLFTDENVLALLDEAKSAESLAIETTILAQFESLLKVKRLNGDDVSLLVIEYKKTKKYLETEKDVNIFSNRLDALLGVKNGDVDKALDALIEKDGKLDTEDAVNLFFGTKKRESKDGLNYQAQQIIDKEGIKSKFLLLYLLVLGNNDLFTIKDKQVPTETYFAKFLSQGNKRFFFALKELDIDNMIKDVVKKDLTAKIGERIKRVIDLSRRSNETIK